VPYPAGERRMPLIDVDRQRGRLDAGTALRHRIDEGELGEVRIVTSRRLVTIVGLSSGRMTTGSASKPTRPQPRRFEHLGGRLRSPAENTSIEKATLRHRLASDTMSIGTRTR